MEEQYDEQRLWNEFISGNDDSFRAIYNHYVNQLFIYGTHFTYDEEMVKDCVQDLFAKLYANRKRLVPVEKVRLYLYSALKNMLFNQFKKESRHYQIDTIEPVFFIEPSKEDELIESERLHEQKRQVARFMEQITPRQREVLYYRFVKEHSYDEICDLMQMNYQSVRNLLHRTLSKLRSLNK
ncbi:MAG: RNA polymerase sigma factor [Tannerella sp.]|nr:RNA polymerase sigma factor [Tannerella sp.]